MLRIFSSLFRKKSHPSQCSSQQMRMILISYVTTWLQNAVLVFPFLTSPISIELEIHSVFDIHK